MGVYIKDYIFNTINVFTISQGSWIRDTNRVPYTELSLMPEGGMNIGFKIGRLTNTINTTEKGITKEKDNYFFGLCYCSFY